ncbi:MAG: cbb3-type cytochrome c oxidase subunit I [Planctomycetaceae bacterium]|nr:cbb3-type cytochrome c oxidase subunit I [Planctomycetaceae bacterium]
MHGTHDHVGGNYLNATKGLKSWLLTLDHKRIGIMYLVSVCIALALGGTFALLLRTKLLHGGYTPEAAAFIGSSKDYNQWMTLHGAVMVFLFMIPAIPAAFGNFVLPMMLGAKDVAFPKLNLFSYYLYFTGTVMFLVVLVMGGLDTGWTMYAPYSIVHSKTAVPYATLAVFILGFSSILTGLNFIATIHKLRPKGMTPFRMPLFLWAIYATSVIQVLATPVIGILTFMLFIEKIMGIGFFNPALGGDPLLFQHLFWFYSHPAVYIMVLPAMGVINEVIPTFSRKPIFGYKMMAFSSLAIAFIGFVVWGHHLFVSGQSPFANVAFSAITLTVAVPSAIKVFNWVSTMYKGDIHFTTPMMYALFFIYLFAIGGLTGIFLTALPGNIHTHDTYFVIAHFHFVMVGAVIFGFLAGLNYWWPKITGKLYNNKAGVLGSVLIFLGFNLTFLPQFVMGLKGMPRRYANYAQEFEIYHQLSTAGAYLLGVGFLTVLLYLLASLAKGKKAPSNPWGAASLDWQSTSPPHMHNFEKTPLMGDPYDYSLVSHDEKTGGYVRKPGEGSSAHH